MEYDARSSLHNSHMTTKILMSIFIGGGIGSVLRYGMQLLMQGHSNPHVFPWATFCTNTIGCFCIGLFYAAASHLNLSAETRLFLTTGLCGGFTTFSTFSNESFLMLREGNFGLLAAYILSSLVIGIAAVFAGSMAGTNWLGK